MSEKGQFDLLVGGTVELPSEITYLRYAAARSKEIQFLKKSLSSSTGNKLVFQKLPKHMRRRAMSHNAKRLPRRLRQIHYNQLEKSGMPQKQKRRCRKYRRRPNNIVEEFARRKLNRIWLNTHLWHAKRFHMVEKWGYKLPNKPCDKAFRACYRATAKHCLLQDVSYYSCIEIEGEVCVITETFKLITDNKLGPSIAAKAYSRGMREGSIILLENNPSRKAIGKVMFNWKPQSSEATNRNLWLWIHPAFYSEVLKTLLDVFKLEQTSMDTDIDIKTQIYFNNLTGIKLIELKSELNRFRLTGPLSNDIVHSCFKLSDINNCCNKIQWFQEIFKDDEWRQRYTDQSNCWTQLKGKLVTEMSPHTVLSVTVEDPRINLPKKKTKGLTEHSNSSNFYIPPSDICFSVLWDEKIRNDVTESKISNARICEMRSNLLIPGTDLVDNTLKVPVPLLFVQRPGCYKSHLGYGSGWDIILPASWAQPIWISLIMWGARAGGLRESESINFEMGQQNILQPDTEAGQREEEEISNLYRDSYFRKPPNRRVNYNKLSICSPFQWRWKMLIKEWKSENGDIEDFYVIRDKRILNSLQVAITSKKYTLESSLYMENCLVPVKLTCLCKGSPTKFGIICLPQPFDFKKEPEEPHKPDSNQNKRKELRKNHKSLLKRLRQRRIRAKKSGKALPVEDEIQLKQYTSQIRKLWEPDIKKVKNSCSRQVIGMIQNGDFSFNQAVGVGIGYIAIGAFKEIIKLGQRKVLFRNTSSRQYRLATLDVICE